MLGVHFFAGMNTGGFNDYWRDMYWASAIAHGERFPLAGPQIYQLFELGPWWYYLLALPMALTGSVALTTGFAQALAAAKYFLAWRLGARIADERFGFLCAISLAIAGWAMLPLMFPSHTGLVETTLLLLAMVVWRSWRGFSAWNAVLFGLACAACLHAHPTTLSYVGLAGVVLLWRHRSRAAIGWMALSVAILVLTLLPPWFESAVMPAGAMKSVPTYLGGEIAVQPIRRIPELLRSLVVGGAWWGFLLMTPWKADVASLAWWVYCSCLVVVAMGLWRLRRSDPRLFRTALVAAAVLVLQIVFVVLLRPITPMWMVASCLLPLGLMVALGWYGWLVDASLSIRIAVAAVMAIYVSLCLAPFSIDLRDLRAVRVMPGVNPFLDVIEYSDRYVNVAVPFYSVRRLDRLAKSLCEPSILHARLAAVVESSLAVPLRNGCGGWPEHRYGGVEGVGPHLAGLLPHAAIASGIAPSRVVAHMALYENVKAIAPPVGGRSAPLKRLQIHPESGLGPPEPLAFDFDAQGGDVVVVTNRLPNAAPMEIRAINAAGSQAALLSDDGSSRLYRCPACSPSQSVRWHVELDAIAVNLDLVVLLHAPKAGASVE